MNMWTSAHAGLNFLRRLQFVNVFPMLLWPVDKFNCFSFRTQPHELGQLFSGIYWRKNRVLDIVIKHNSIIYYGRQTTLQWMHLALERGSRRDITFVSIEQYNHRRRYLGSEWDKRMISLYWVIEKESTHFKLLSGIFIDSVLFNIDWNMSWTTECRQMKQTCL